MTQDWTEFDRFGYWLAGFADGEGCFIMRKTSGRCYTFSFIITLRDDDADILEECAARTGLGKVSYCKGRGTSRDQARWIVANKVDCFLLVGLFDTYPLRAKKKRDYAIWREAVMLWQDCDRDGKNPPFDWSPIARLHDELRQVREYVAV